VEGTGWECGVLWSPKILKIDPDMYLSLFDELASFDAVRRRHRLSESPMSE